MKPAERKILCNYCYFCIEDNENHYCNKAPKTSSNNYFKDIWNKIIKALTRILVPLNAKILI